MSQLNRRVVFDENSIFHKVSRIKRPVFRLGPGLPQWLAGSRTTTRLDTVIVRTGLVLPHLRLSALLALRLRLLTLVSSRGLLSHEISP